MADDNMVTTQSVIIDCLMQKKIFLARILDVSKQIEVQSRQKEINLITQLKEREELFRRIEKCDNLIKKQIDDAPDDVACNLKKALEKKNFDSQFSEIAKLEAALGVYSEKILSVNRQADENLKNRYNDVKSQLATTRNRTTVKYGNMFK